MEVDMQSPPSTFRPVSFSIKRPRSPASPTQERQTKRLFLAPLGSEGLGVRRASTASDAVADGRLANQDDWVRQARELSITSPLSITASFLPTMDSGATVTQSRVDEHMAVDDEEAQALRVHVPPGARSRSHLPSIHITTTATQGSSGVSDGLLAPSPAPFSVLTEPPSSTESASPTSSISVAQTGRGEHLCPPDIFLFPPTPEDVQASRNQFAAGYAQQGGAREPAGGPHARMANGSLSQASLTRVQDRTEGSPRPSRAPDVPASSGKKHRVTMGPRADCVKCRTGVRGHWMHFD